MFEKMKIGNNISITGQTGKFPYSLAMVLLVIVVYIFNSILHFPGNVLCFDVFGYYLYLPQFFIYHHPDNGNIETIKTIVDTYQNTPTLYQLIDIDPNTRIIKYSMGMALLYLPFFLIGHLWAGLSAFPADGFSFPYQAAIHIGSVFYVCLGVWMLRKILLHFFSDKATAITVLSVFFGTNYYFHSVFYGQETMSHSYLFTLYTFIIWYTIKWHQAYKQKHLYLLAIFCGITILARPSEVVCLLIPFFFSIKNGETFLNKIKLIFSYKKQFFIFFLIMFLIGSIQFIYWKIYTGHFLFNSYANNNGEGFEFFHPYILEVLFSFRKGWLVYTPIMIFAVIGFYFLFKKNKEVFAAFLIYFLLNLYIVSSWSCWWYAESFGQRALIPSYVALSFPLAAIFQFFLNKKSNVFKVLFFCLLIGFISLNFFQTWQFVNGIMKPDRMTKAYYKSVFLKTKYNKEWESLLMVNRTFDGSEKLKNIEDYFLTKTLYLKDKNGNLEETVLPENEFSGFIEIPFDSLTQKDHVWIKTFAVVKAEDTAANYLMSMYFSYKDRPYKFGNAEANSFSSDSLGYKTLTMDYLTPEVRSKKDKFRVYIWNRERQKLNLKKLYIEVYEKRP